MRLYFGYGDGDRGATQGGILVVANSQKEARRIAWRSIGDEWIHSGAYWLKRSQHLLKFADQRKLTKQVAHEVGFHPDATCGHCGHFLIDEAGCKNCELEKECDWM